jgi:hypothetical protein
MNDNQSTTLEGVGGINGQFDETLFDLNLFADADSDSLATDPFSDRGDTVHFGDADGNGDFTQSMALDVLDDQDGVDESHDLVAALTYAAEKRISKSGRSGRAQASQVKKSEAITADDFPAGGERAAFLVIQRYADDLFGKRKIKAHEALEFFFGSTLAPDNLVSFDLCCKVLSTRPDVFRLRIQYEWFLKGIVFTGPFDFPAKPVPELLDGHIHDCGGFLAYVLAREAWFQPGISTEELTEVVIQMEDFCSSEKISACLAQLSDDNLLCYNMGWYLTGRNPMLASVQAHSRYGVDVARGGSRSWSSLFG